MTSSRTRRSLPRSRDRACQHHLLNGTRARARRSRRAAHLLDEPYIRIGMIRSWHDAREIIGPRRCFREEKPTASHRTKQSLRIASAACINDAVALSGAHRHHLRRRCRIEKNGCAPRSTRSSLSTCSRRRVCVRAKSSNTRTRNEASRIGIARGGSPAHEHVGTTSPGTVKGLTGRCAHVSSSLCCDAFADLRRRFATLAAP